LTRGNALLSLHAAVALFGFAALFGKWIALPAAAIVLGRTVVAAATLVIVSRARHQPVGRPGMALVANGAILALHWVSFFAAVQIASVAVALLGYATFPLFVLLLDRRPLGGLASVREVSTAVMAVVGLVALVPEFSWSSAASRGLILGVVSGFTFAWLSVRTRQLVRLHLTPTRIALWQNAFAAACLLPIVVLFHATASPSMADIALLLVLGVVCTGLAHTLFIASLQRVSAHSASVVAALEPVYGIALAVWLLHEVPGVRTMVGGALIVAAALFASRRSA
jgi:drug/metabolite transporter (DMT)-like permease